MGGAQGKYDVDGVVERDDDPVLRFVQSAEGLHSREAVLSGFLDALAPLGVRFLIYVTTDPGRTNRYLWSNVGIHENPAADDFLDPFLEYCCSTYGSTYTGVEFLADYPYLSERERAFIRSAGEQGFKSGLGLPVRLDNGSRFGGFNLGTGFDRETFMSRVATAQAKLAHACVLLNRVLEEMPREAVEGSPPMPDLTPRERDILYLLSHGHSRKDIAKMTSLTTNTISSYIKTLYTKLGVTNRAQATRASLAHDLKPPSL